MTHDVFYRKPAAQQETGILANSTWYAYIANGLLPPPVKIGVRSSAWLVSEIVAVKRARIQGLTNDEIRVLVKELVAARSNVTGDTCHD